MTRPFGKRTVIGTAVLLICLFSWSSAAAARVVETVLDGVIILFIETRYTLHSSAVGGRVKLLPTIVLYVAGPTATAC